jgi:CheY-like chemotaxis protein
MSVAKSAAKLMLVDDNPVILDLMRRGIAAHAEITAYTDAEKALRKCLEDPPDLVICDYRMPIMDGGQFVKKLKAKPETQGIRVILVAAKADIDERLRPMADLVEELFVKPFFVKELAARTKKVLERVYWEKMQKEAPQEGVIRGRLSEMNIIDLLQSLELGQKTCGLTVTQDVETCRMFFAEGQISHAESGSVQGDQAVYGVVGWADGSFQIDFNARSEKRTTTQSTQGLLMEALRLLDEQNRGPSEAPSEASSGTPSEK